MRMPPRAREITLKATRLLRNIHSEDAAAIMLLKLTSRAYSMGFMVGLVIGCVAMAIACSLGALVGP